MTRYRIFLEQAHYASSTINLRLAAVRRLAYEAADAGLLSPDLAAGIRRVKGAKKHGTRVGNWLRSLSTFESDLSAWQARLRHGRRPTRVRPATRRVGCGASPRSRATRRPLGLYRPDREGRSHQNGSDTCLGCGCRPRLVNRSWSDGRSCVPRHQQGGSIAPNGLSPKVIWGVVKQAAACCGLANIAPHDLRRTCARLCHLAGGELEQIQFLLGQISVETTERYLSCKQRLRNAVNDKLGLEPPFVNR